MLRLNFILNLIWINIFEVRNCHFCIWIPKHRDFRLFVHDLELLFFVIPGVVFFIAISFVAFNHPLSSETVLHVPVQVYDYLYGEGRYIKLDVIRLYV
jgi:hypothetical protein